jgi:hypothetical protein
LRLLNVLQNDLHVFALLFVQFARESTLENRSELLNRSQRRAQLVRHMRQKIVFQFHRVRRSAQQCAVGRDALRLERIQRVLHPLAAVIGRGYCFGQILSLYGIEHMDRSRLRAQRNSCARALLHASKIGIAAAP